MLKKVALSLITLIGLATAAEAIELKPVHAVKIDIGSTSALTYYTEEGAAYRVVTLLQDEVGVPPVQIVSMLRPGDHTVITAPRSFDGTAPEMWVARVGNRVLVGPKNGIASN